MYRDLKNKIIILTGGSGFLGQQIVNAFRSTKSKIIILDIIKPKNNKAKFYKCNITNENEVLTIAKKIKNKYKKIDILINNAASDYIPNQKKEKLSLENLKFDVWKKDLNVGLDGAFICTKVFGSIMASKKKGVILNISSDLGIIAPTQDIYKSLNFIKPVTYSVVKHGINGLTKYTAAAVYFVNPLIGQKIILDVMLLHQVEFLIIKIKHL